MRGAQGAVASLPRWWAPRCMTLQLATIARREGDERGAAEMRCAGSGCQNSGRRTRRMAARGKRIVSAWVRSDGQPGRSTHTHGSHRAVLGASAGDGSEAGWATVCSVAGGPWGSGDTRLLWHILGKGVLPGSM